MTSVFQKLNLKGQREIAVFNAPASFEPELAALEDITVVRNPSKVEKIQFALAFAFRRADLDRLSRSLAAAAEGDAILWFAYPKGTSKLYTCEFNRDTGWEVIRKAGFESVRQVAIDDDWSALRFRRLKYVKASTKRPEQAQDDRLAKLTKLCLALPEVERRIRGDHADFRVRGKVFAYFLDDHHGDGIVSVCCKTELGENVDRASREPQRFYIPPYIGPRGWVGLRLDGKAILWPEVQNLVEQSYRLVAPKRLAKSSETARVPASGRRAPRATR